MEEMQRALKACDILNKRHGVEFRTDFMITATALRSTTGVSD